MLLIRKPWDSQPQEVVGVDWSNPLSAGLVSAFLPTGSTFFDAVSGLVASTSGAVVSATPSPVIDGNAAAAIEIRGSTGTLAFPTGSTGLDKIAGPFSIFAEGGLRLNGSSENLISSQDASLGKGIQLLFDDAIAVLNGFVTRIDNSSRGNSGSGALGSNSELYAHRMMCSGDGANIYSYAKRALVKTDAAAFTPTANASRVTRFFGTPFSSGNKTGGTVVYAFSRALSLAEYQRLYDNPWQLLAPRTIWVPVSAATGGAYTLTADAGAYVIGGQDAALVKSRIVAADAGAYSLAGQDAALTYAPAAGAYTLTAEPGAYVLGGQDAALKRGRVVSAAAGAYALAGQDATLTYAPPNAYTLTCEAGAYAISGQDAAFFYSGEEVATPRRHAGGYRQRKGYIIKGQRYWLDEVELAVKVAELITDISRGDIKEVTAGKPKTISKRTWDAIKPLERIEAMADMLNSNDDEEEALLMLM